MTIPIKIETTKGSEWAIIELQGELKPLHVSKEIYKDCVGNLHYDKYGIPILVIGHHILQGREETLSKPMAVLERLKISDADSSVLDASVSCDTLLDKTVALENKMQHSTQYAIKAICTKKLIFKVRPKPIIMKS